MHIHRRKPINGNGHEAELAKVESLRTKMEDRAGAVDNNVRKYVQATLEYGVAQTRSEYRPLANRNWKVIQRFGVRFMRTMAALVLVLALLGALSYKTISDIQEGRRNSVLEKCHSGEQFDRKLKARIAKLPEPAKKEAHDQITFTEGLVSTIVPISHDKCAKALKLAGLRP